MDTSKVGGNKYVNYTFEDYMKDFGLSRKGAIRDLEEQDIFLTDLKPIAPKVEQPKNIMERVDQLLLGYDQPVEIVGGKVVGKYRPTGLDRFTTGIMPYELLGFTDFDKRGDLFGKNELSGYGGLPTNYELPKSLKESLAEQDKAKKEKESKDPVESIKDAVEGEIYRKEKMDPINRKSKLIDAALESAVMRANMPFITNTMKDISAYKQQQLLDAEAIKQGMPNALQARMLAGDTGFAQQAGAISSLADSATRMAGLGVFPRNVIYRV